MSRFSRWQDASTRPAKRMPPIRAFAVALRLMNLRNAIVVEQSANCARVFREHAIDFVAERVMVLSRSHRDVEYKWNTLKSRWRNRFQHERIVGTFGKVAGHRTPYDCDIDIAAIDSINDL